MTHFVKVTSPLKNKWTVGTMEKTLFASLVITVAVNSTLGFVIRDRHRSEEAANGRSEERVHDVERGHAVEVPSISENLLRSSTGDESIESKGKQKQHAIEVSNLKDVLVNILYSPRQRKVLN